MRVRGRILAFLLTILFAAMSLPAVAQADMGTVPNLIRYSGTLKDSQGAASVATTTVGVTFAIYKQQDGGAPIWQETQNITPDVSGHYTVLLGTTTATGVPDDLFSPKEQRWLGIQPQGEAEQPRVLMVSVPYAFKAHDAETLGGLPASAFVRAPAGSGSASNAETLGALETGAATGNNGKAGKSGTGIDTVINCTLAANNYIPVFTAVRPPNITICNSVMYQLNGNIGIGTTTPTQPLEVLSNSSVNVAVIEGFSTATSGSVAGVEGKTASNGGYGVYGVATSTIGTTYGVEGTVASNAGAGVLGIASSTTGAVWGVQGGTDSNGGDGVHGVAISMTGNTNGVYGRSQSSSGNGVAGIASSAAGATNGVYGESDSNDNNAAGVYGIATSTSGTNYGVQGNTGSSSGAGVLGIASSTTGAVWGVQGGTNSSSGDGVHGVAISPSGHTNGVYGKSLSPDGFGVYGVNTATSGSANGVAGYTASTAQNASGVYGEATPTSGATNGVYGLTNSSDGNADGVYGKATSTSGGASGVSGLTESRNGYGVWGIAASTDKSGRAIGVYGQSNTGPGVYGSELSSDVCSAGVTGISASTCSDGVAGINTATSGNANGIFGQTYSSQGVAGYFDNEGGGYVLVAVVNGGPGHLFDVDGSGNGKLAGSLTASSLTVTGSGQINGDLNVGGTLTKGGGSFKIDDPLDPANKYLSHSFVESPDMMNIYNGSVKLNARGEVWVTMPDYFEALNRNFQYVLTAIGRPQPYLYIAKKMSGNRFKIAGGKPNAEVSWQVTGIRHDAWANAYRIPVEEDKPDNQRGHYLHPELFGADSGRSVSARLSQPQAMKQK